MKRERKGKEVRYSKSKPDDFYDEKYMAHDKARFWLRWASCRFLGVEAEGAGL